MKPSAIETFTEQVAPTVVLIAIGRGALEQARQAADLRREDVGPFDLDRRGQLADRCETSARPLPGRLWTWFSTAAGAQRLQIGRRGGSRIVAERRGGDSPTSRSAWPAPPVKATMPVVAATSALTSAAAV